MNIRCISAHQLSAAEIAAWSAIQRAHAEFSSAYFRPEFTQAVAAVRADVDVAIMEEGGAPVGFFPFQRTGWGAGRPVGGRLSDFHALVAPPDVECDPVELLSACRLTSWQFDHLVAVHAAFARFAWSSAESPVVDLRDGFDRYIAQRENGSRLMAEYRKKRRRLEQKLGPLRYVPHVRDHDVLETCLRWKTGHHAQLGSDRIFERSWIVKLLHTILDSEGPDFGPALSATYAGQEIVAVHFGLRCRDVLHCWFPTYDAEFAEYSPGFLHWMECMRCAHEEGVSRIDLGKGDEIYKKRLMTGAIHVAQGAIDVRTAVAAARRAWRSAEASIKASPLYGPARMPARVLRRVRNWIELR